MVEVLISLLLVMVAAGGGLAVIAASMKATSFANGVQAASRLGQDVLDRAMAEPWDSLTGTGTDPVCRDPVDPAPITVSPQGGSAGNFTQYTRRCFVTPLASDGSGVLLRGIRVVVTWTDSGDGRSHSITLGTFRAR